MKITVDPDTDPKPKRKERKAKAGKGKTLPFKSIHLEKHLLFI